MEAVSLGFIDEYPERDSTNLCIELVTRVLGLRLPFEDLGEETKSQLTRLINGPQTVDVPSCMVSFDSEGGIGEALVRILSLISRIQPMPHQSIDRPSRGLMDGCCKLQLFRSKVWVLLKDP